MENSVRIHPGKPEPLGLSYSQGVANFSIYSAHASKGSLCLFWSNKSEPDAVVPLQGPYIGIWYVAIEGLPAGVAYGYRFEGNTSSYDPKRILSDPYAKSLANFYPWGEAAGSRLPLLCFCNPLPPFDWQGVERPKIPLENLIIYEMHVRGFTKDPSSGASAPGTYLGIIEKIPHLKKLGVNAVELLPIFEFDETHSHPIHPQTNRPLLNYWGYSPLSFFLPMSRYAKEPAKAAEEFKTMVRELHRAGIEVILDVVYNHTTEDDDYVASFRGIDKESYYMLDEDGNDKNYSGCGNTFQTNTPTSLRIILDSLRYWTKEMHVDGFRFDLASILTRGPNGEPMEDPPILKTIAKDPVLKNARLIAEPWDAAGLYQVGQFPKWGCWSGWNGVYRDHVRRFIKGTDREAGAFATALCGSGQSYGPAHTPLSSINFITAHDGFSLHDLVSYQDKHNEENGEENRDGTNSNDSWNCGVEGPSDDPEICILRERQKRNFWLALFLSQGIPMFCMGDEVSHSRKGNNNPYPQDNEINWFNWNDCKEHADQLDFVSSLIRFRQKQSILHQKKFLKPSDIQWHGRVPDDPDWSDPSRFVAFTLQGGEQTLYAAFNAHFETAQITLPPLNNDQCWKQIVRTDTDWNIHSFNDPEKGEILPIAFEIPSHSAILAIASKR